MTHFPREQIEQVLSDLQRRFPHATEADALTILQDAEWADEDERRFFDADDAEREAELEFMALDA